MKNPLYREPNTIKATERSHIHPAFRVGWWGILFVLDVFGIFSPGGFPAPFMIVLSMASLGFMFGAIIEWERR